MPSNWCACLKYSELKKTKKKTKKIQQNFKKKQKKIVFFYFFRSARWYEMLRIRYFTPKQMNTTNTRNKKIFSVSGILYSSLELYHWLYSLFYFFFFCFYSVGRFICSSDDLNEYRLYANVACVFIFSSVNIFDHWFEHKNLKWNGKNK